MMQGCGRGVNIEKDGRNVQTEERGHVIITMDGCDNPNK